MDRHAQDELTIEDLADKLNVGERWLRELFQQQIGASPQSILLSKKLDIARSLLDGSTQSITDVAFSSGFQSIRRFNDAFKKRFKKTPSAFRQKPASKSSLYFQLSYRPPFSWQEILNYFEYRTIPSLERVKDNTYQRLITHGDIRGWFKVQCTAENKINIELKLNKIANMLEFSTRFKHMFDLNADPMEIAKNLSQDRKLKPYLSEKKGLRIPGCWDGFELAVRAVVGQKISVKGAHKTLDNIVQACGEKQTLDKTLELKYFFPTPRDILNSDLSNLGLTQAKITTIRSLAEHIDQGTLTLDSSADYDETCQQLLSIKGIGPWTMEYIALRALRNPDAFPETDLELQKKIKQLHLDPKKWSPWRGYVAILLWGL